MNTAIRRALQAHANKRKPAEPMSGVTRAAWVARVGPDVNPLLAFALRARVASRPVGRRSR